MFDTALLSNVLMFFLGASLTSIVLAYQRLKENREMARGLLLTKAIVQAQHDVIEDHELVDDLQESLDRHVTEAELEARDQNLHEPAWMELIPLR